MPLPSVAEALYDLGDMVEFQAVGKGISDFETVEKFDQPITFYGVVEPTPPSVLRILPEGERIWRHWSLWSPTYLERDWIVKNVDGLQYRVMERSIWGSYFEYRIAENPTHA